ncbi:MAG TPA: histidine kinase, partial [Gemmatimonadales bacterium]|nr:histidine kinase [Gemmatimonadales bacterium]
MPPDLPVTAPSEFAAALLQGTVTAAFALLCAHLAARYRRAWFQWWAGASALYLLRVVCIVTFLSTGNWAFLFLHQVFTGWTGVALLWAAFAFGGRLPRRGVLVAAALFPPVWSWIAIYQLDVFFWAALPAVVFLSLATLWTGVTFLRWRGRSGEGVGATVLATAFLLWGLHHLDYPFLRARGAWSPWGYYLDILFIVAVGSGLLLLVVDEQRRGLAALSTLSGDLERGGATERLVELLERPLLLPGVRGSALVQLTRDGPLAVRGLGTLERLGEIPAVVQQALDTGEPQVTAGWVAALPIFREGRVSGALVMTGAGRDPFAVLDRSFLTTLGRQVGAALAMGDLTARVAERTKELEHLSRRMLVQHEDERRRLARELHDETAQVLSAVKMQLGVLRDALTPDDQARLDRTQALLDEGIRGIRSVTHDLRPTLLDDLGL